MELKHLKSFVAVARLSNFSTAAKELHTVQPAISRHIFALEEELGVKLFFRNSREVMITTAGERLLKEATELLDKAEAAKELVIKTFHGEIGTLTVAYLGGATLSFIPSLIQQYRGLFPDVDINLIEMTASEQITAFEQNKIDIGFSRPMPEMLNKVYESVDIYTDTLMAILPNSHPLALEKSIELSLLRNETFVLFARSEAVGIFDSIIGLCQQAEFSPWIKNQPAQMQTMLTQVAAGIGISIAPGSVRKLVSTGCRFVAINGVQPSIPLVLHHHKNLLSPNAQAFKKLVIEATPDIQKIMSY